MSETVDFSDVRDLLRDVFGSDVDEGVLYELMLAPDDDYARRQAQTPNTVVVDKATPSTPSLMQPSGLAVDGEVVVQLPSDTDAPTFADESGVGGSNAADTRLPGRSTSRQRVNRVASMLKNKITPEGAAAGAVQLSKPARSRGKSPKSPSPTPKSKERQARPSTSPPLSPRTRLKAGLQAANDVVSGGWDGLRKSSRSRTPTARTRTEWEDQDVPVEGVRFPQAATPEEDTVRL
eukprot:2755036-Rhodomonas_salina.1